MENQGVFSEFVTARNVRSYSSQKLPIWLPKHEPDKDNNNRHAKVDLGSRSAGGLDLYKELQTSKECWEQEKQSATGKSKPVSFLLLNGHL